MGRGRGIGDRRGFVEWAGLDVGEGRGPAETGRRGGASEIGEALWNGRGGGRGGEGQTKGWGYGARLGGARIRGPEEGKGDVRRSKTGGEGLRDELHSAKGGVNERQQNGLGLAQRKEGAQNGKGLSVGERRQRREGVLEGGGWGDSRGRVDWRIGNEGLREGTGIEG